MQSRPCKCILVSDFNIENLAGYLRNSTNVAAGIEVTVSPFGQVIQVLTQDTLHCWRENPDFAVVWTRPEGVVESFNDLLQYKQVPLEKILEEVDEYASMVARIQDRVRFVLVPSWVIPAYNRGVGILDMRTGVGISNALMRMNLRLSEHLEKIPGYFFLDTARWVNVAGNKAFNPKLWYMAKIAFGNGVFTEATKDIEAAVNGFAGKGKKLVILDLDDTLWGGIVGDVGWENLRLGGHDHVGEAYVDFQRALKALKNRGILIALVSKNEESIALEAIKSHPEMVLQMDDFAGWRINWQDKAHNIVELVSDLNLGLESAVFIDDNPVERARVRETLPEILVPELPQDKMLYKSALLGLHCFDTPTLTEEDRKKARMYVVESRRQSLKQQIGSLDEWLKTLDTKVKVSALNKPDLPRTTQLLNKTNQMNLSTRRMSETELWDWANRPDCSLWTFRVLDRFGDSGLTGIASIQVEGRMATLVDFVLSCRVMGRKIEETMLHVVVSCAQSMNVDEIHARYIPTARNNPCLKVFEAAGLHCDPGDNLFKWPTTKPYTLPSCISLQWNDREGESY